ncbi:glycosyltransferase family 2 protein [Candidatus Symbiobacter mobilis]|uniref:Spore maturation protein CgeD n=1 Tax=Candidatus Symbiobacter mobilis CR TaxID=946483 RepID=U5NBA7_9BURK|nr:glycosyltransferase family 2 protein [Candidatus Symbiobacter mobilis]AGX88707.1 spore maturation protein CgeD [Candidatus Symbiobacter mobilis CR]
MSEHPTEPLVSVLIPTHNRPDYLEVALRSALAQRYANLEIVVSDNGDDDLTAQRIQPYLQAHPHIRYFRRQGMSATENWDKCMELSRGEYLNYLMDDDAFHPDKISRMMQCFQAHPDVGLVTSFRQLIDERGNPLPPVEGTERLFAQDTMVTGSSFGRYILALGSNLIGEPTTVLFRRADLRGPFGTFLDRRYTVLSDIATWLSILARWDAVYLVDPMSYFRIHFQQDQRDNSTRLRASLEWMTLFLDSHEHGLFSEEEPAFLDLLAAKLGGLSQYLTLHYPSIRGGSIPAQDIVDGMQRCFHALLHRQGAPSPLDSPPSGTSGTHVASKGRP